MENKMTITEAIHQRDALANAVCDAAVKAGIILPGTPVDGAQLLLLINDLVYRPPVLTMPHTWQDADGTECVSADSVREMLVDAGLSITG